MLEPIPLPTSPRGLLTVREAGRVWLVKPRVRWGSLRWTVTEYVSGELARAVGLPVPEQRPIFLPADLSAFWSGPKRRYQAGFNLGIRYLDGLTLKEARALGCLNHITHEGDLAAGIVLTDTWLANFDRSHGSYLPAAHVPAENEGNLFFACGRGRWQVYAIDYSHALAMCHWGCWANEAWPPELLGTMSLFFEKGWLGPEMDMLRFECWLQRLETLELADTLGEIRQTLPQDWLNGDPYYREADWQDLEERLERQREQLREILRAKYDQAAVRARRLHKGQAKHDASQPEPVQPAA